MKQLLPIISICALMLFAGEQTVDPAQVSQGTTTRNDLLNLPLPEQRISVAVYSFRDQTGQYRPTSLGTNYSTAVTQGGTSMLVKALEDSRWFTVVEREGLNDLITERKIITLNNRPDANGVTTQLPPLLSADVLLEGGIISYETNIVTGGVGARYLGVGANVSMQKDRVTVYLRAVSTKTGEVLKSVTTSKTIISRMTDLGVYRFVSFKKLLEIETGLSVNEPPQLCVQEAIEKAVFTLVAEGVISGLWSLSNGDDLEHELFSSYQSDKDIQYEELEKLSGTTERTPVERVFFIVGLGAEVPESQPLNSGVMVVTVGCGYDFTQNITISFDANLHSGHYKELRTSNFDLELGLNMLPERIVSPIFKAGGTLFYTAIPDDRSIAMNSHYGAGITYGVGITSDIPSIFRLEWGVTNHTLLGSGSFGSDIREVGDHFWSGYLAVTFSPLKKR